MRWEDERYIRFFTRDTPEFMALSWQARGLLGLLMRKVDRAGILAVGKLGLKGVAVAVGGPWAEIENPLQELLDDGCVAYAPATGTVMIPNFMDAQECSQSDKARKRASREKARATFGGSTDASEKARAALNVTERDGIESQDVTESHAESQPVTPSHTESLQSYPSPDPSPSRTEPARGEASAIPADGDLWGLKQRVASRSKGRIDERCEGERERGLSTIGKTGWARLVGDLDAICDCVAIDAGLAYLERSAEDSRQKFTPSLGAWLGRADAGYPADALFSLSRTAKEWLAKRSAPKPLPFRPPASTGPAATLADIAAAREKARASNE